VIRVSETIGLDEHTERELSVLARGRRVEARLRQGAHVILLAALGLQNRDLAVEVGLDRRQVALWRQRFLYGGIVRATLPHDSKCLVRPCCSQHSTRCTAA
jgi:hypothetical protein